MNKLDNMHKKLTQTERNKRYENKHKIQQLKIALKPSELEIIDNLKNRWNTTNKDTILKACKYCVDNNINLTATDNRAEDR